MFFKCGLNDVNIKINDDFHFAKYYNKINNEVYRAFLINNKTEYLINTNNLVNENDSDSTNDTDNETEED